MLYESVSDRRNPSMEGMVIGGGGGTWPGSIREEGELNARDLFKADLSRSCVALFSASNFSFAT